MVVDGLVFGVPTAALIGVTVWQEWRDSRRTARPVELCQSCERSPVRVAVWFGDGDKARVCRACFCALDTSTADVLLSRSLA